MSVEQSVEWMSGKPKYSTETYLSASLSTKNPSLLDLGLNPGRCCEKPANNRLTYITGCSKEPWQQEINLSSIYKNAN
jgi:hypothetical protein